MKKMLLFAAVCGAAFVMTGCTSVESTQKFNALGLASREDKAVCHTSVEIPCYTFWGLPIFGGSKERDKMAVFQNNADVESVIYLLTQEIRSKGGARVINAQTSMSEREVFLGFFTKRTMIASGTGVRTRNEAIDQAAQSYDTQLAPAF